jgi:hypothetical protein
MITNGVQAEKVSPLSPVEMLVVVPMDDEKGKQLPVSHVKPPIQKNRGRGKSTMQRRAPDRSAARTNELHLLELSQTGERRDSS